MLQNKQKICVKKTKNSILIIINVKFKKICAKMLSTTPVSIQGINDANDIRSQITYFNHFNPISEN